jgi:hypothetical protein
MNVDVSACPRNQLPLWHHSQISTLICKSLRNIRKFRTHARQNITPQIMNIVLFGSWCSGIPQQQIRRNRCHIPNPLVNFSIQLSWNPCGMSFDKESFGRIELMDSNFIHEFFGTTDKDTWSQFFGTFDETKAMKDGKVLCEDGATISDGSLLKSKLEREIEIGSLFGSNLVVP